MQSINMSQVKIINVPIIPLEDGVSTRMCDNSSFYDTSSFDKVYEDLNDLYMSNFNGGKGNLDYDIQMLNEIFVRGKLKYIREMRKKCSIMDKINVVTILNQTLTVIKTYLKIVPVIITSDNEITLRDLQLKPTGKDSVYNISILPQENQFINLLMINVTFKNIYITVDNSKISASIIDSVFIKAGIHIKSKSHGKHLAITIDNCTFLGDIDYNSVEVINTTNVSISSTTFKDLKCEPEAIFLQCFGSQLELKNTSFVGCEPFAEIIFLNTCNVTATFLTVLKNYGNYGDVSKHGKITITLRVEDSTLNVSKSTFEDNSNRHLIYFASNDLIWTNALLKEIKSASHF